MGKRTRSSQKANSSNAACSSSQQDVSSKKRRRRSVGSSGAPVKVQTDHCYIIALPPELLTQIFGYLEVEDKGRVARVCTVWNRIVYHPSLWKGLCAKVRLNKLGVAVFNSLKTRGIRQVNVLDRCHSEKLQQLVTTLPDMETLSLEKRSLFNQQLESIFLGRTLPHLTCLCLRCKNLDGVSIRSALKKKENLKHIEFLAFCPRYFFLIMSVLKKVQHLIITFDSPRLGDAPHNNPMPCMTTLVLKTAKVDDSVLLYLKQAFPNLEHLEVDLHHKVSAQGIQHLAEMKQLRRLFLRSQNCPGEWMDCLKGGLTDLQVLVLEAYSLHFDCLMTLTEIPSLRDLSVRTCSLSWGECKTLLESCGNMMRFALTLHELLPENNPLPRPLPLLPRLEEVCLHICSGLEDGHIKVLCQALPSLEKLDLESTISLTNDSLKYVAEVPTLKSLLVNSNHETISGTGLEHLRTGRASLQDLSLHNLWKVRDADIQNLQGLESLQRLLIFGCSVSDKALIDCANGLPHLQLLEADMYKKSKRQLKRMRPGLTVRILTP